MKIQYLSDLHLEVAPMDVPVCDADVVVLAGDIHSDGRIAIDWASNFPQEVIYILGNHEFYSGGTISDLPKELKNYAEKYSNVHVLNDDSIVIKGIAFHGCTLWTDFELYGKPDVAFFYADKSLNDYRLINFDRRQAFTPAIAAALHMQSMGWLSETICSSKFVNNVVVTHHLPTPDAIHARFEGNILNSAFASDCSRLFDKGITVWIYGHNHDCRVFEKEGIIFATNQRGYYRYEAIPDFEPNKTIVI